MVGAVVETGTTIVETTGKILRETPPVVAVVVGGFILAGVSIWVMQKVCCSAMAGKGTNS